VAAQLVILVSLFVPEDLSILKVCKSANAFNVSTLRLTMSVKSTGIQAVQEVV
jgi:hypothetical protein